MKLLGIIPARGGSKGILKKNLQKIGDKTLLEYAIEVAIDSNIFDKVVVDSDDTEILHSASQYPLIETPFVRPKKLSGDKVPTSDVVSHLLEWLKLHENYIPDIFMLLEPTCPFRKPAELREAYELFCEKLGDGLISVSEPFQHPSDIIFEKKYQSFEYCLKRKGIISGRQDYHKAWFINGAIFMTRVSYFLSTKRFYDLSSCLIYKMPIWSGIDIDTPFDLEIARSYYQLIVGGQKSC